MGGVGNNNFAPRDPYTREQSIITFLRFFEYVLAPESALQPSPVLPLGRYISVRSGSGLSNLSFSELPFIEISEDFAFVFIANISGNMREISGTYDYDGTTVRLNITSGASHIGGRSSLTFKFEDEKLIYDESAAAGVTQRGHEFEKWVVTVYRAVPARGDEPARPAVTVFEPPPPTDPPFPPLPPTQPAVNTAAERTVIEQLLRQDVVFLGTRERERTEIRNVSTYYSNMLLHLNNGQPFLSRRAIEMYNFATTFPHNGNTTSASLLFGRDGSISTMLLDVGAGPTHTRVASWPNTESFWGGNFTYTMNLAMPGRRASFINFDSAPEWAQFVFNPASATIKAVSGVEILAFGDWDADMLTLNFSIGADGHAHIEGTYVHFRARGDTHYDKLTLRSEFPISHYLPGVNLFP
jgi:hypothetical protein